MQPVRPLSPTSLSPRKGSQLQTGCLSRGVQDLDVQYWPYLHVHLHPTSKAGEEGGGIVERGGVQGHQGRGRHGGGQRCGVWRVGWGCQLVSDEASWNTIHNKLSLCLSLSLSLSLPPSLPPFISLSQEGLALTRHTRTHATHARIHERIHA